MEFHFGFVYLLFTEYNDIDEVYLKTEMEEISLKWNECGDNTIRTFGQLRKNEAFQDVTLVTDDKKQISAHKVVLSACSRYFDNILRQNTHSHPLLCLDSVNFLDLKNIIDYIYDGEVKISHNSYDTFMRCAQKFELEGLNASIVLDGNEISQEADNINEEIIESSFEKLQVQGEKVSLENNEIWNSQIEKEKHETIQDNEHNSDVPFETLDTKFSVSEHTILVSPQNTKEKLKNLHKKEIEQDLNKAKRYFKTYKISLESSEFSSIEEVDDYIQQQILQTSTGGHQCKVCQKIMGTPIHMRFHVETHLQGVTFKCDVCGKKSRSRGALRTHVNKHKNS